MGGNALKHLNVQRIDATEYGNRLTRFVDIIDEIMETNPGLSVLYGFPMSLYGKTDHGDLDVIYYANDVNRLTDALTEAFDSKGYKRNGQVTSIEWENFQVDMIYASLETYEWQLSWYSHGDASAIRGRVYRYYNFKFGHDGLYYNIRTKNMSKDILITRDWVTAHKIMGYKALSNYYMYKEQDIFEHTLTSPYAHVGIFGLLNPDRPRATQTAFYEWVQENALVEEIPREFGLKLLQRYDKMLYLKVVTEHFKMKFREFYNPIKKKYRKFMWTKVYPVAFKVKGWL